MNDDDDDDDDNDDKRGAINDGDGTAGEEIRAKCTDLVSSNNSSGGSSGGGVGGSGGGSSSWRCTRDVYQGGAGTHNSDDVG